MQITSYADLTQYLTQILTNNISTSTGATEEADSEGAPHGAFWNTLSYDQFIDGNVPGVIDPDTGKHLPILVKGNAGQSNLVLALQGAAGTIFDPNKGSVGQMPADGPPFLTSDQIKPIEDWINAGCPE